MFKKSFAIATLIGAGVAALSSSALAASGSVYGSWSDGIGSSSSVGIFFYETSQAYHDQTGARGYSSSYAYDSLYGYLGGDYHSILYLYPSSSGNVSWSNGNNRSYSISYSGTSSFLGSSQAAPAWTSCGTNCVSGTKNWNYDKDLFNHTFYFSLCGLPLYVSAHVVGYASASLYTKAYSNSTASYIMNQGSSSSITGTAGIYGNFQGGIGWGAFASVSAGAVIDIINGSLPNNAYTQATCTSAGNVSRSSRSRGTINVGGGGGWFYVEACLAYICQQGTVADWGGWSRTYNLWDSGVVNNTYDLW
ncbi:MAG TPA: hypothetical protein VIV60_18835 [Polyangiaceae bacterium]